MKLKMIHAKYVYIVIFLHLYSTLHIIFAQEVCDKSRCPGPLAYYESIHCAPIYGSEASCCPVRYDCTHLKERSMKDRCYFNGHVYEIGEKLREEDTRPCDMGCSCRKGHDDIAGFFCAVVDCFTATKTNCYRKMSLDSCCPGEEVCPEDAAEIPRCEVDGVTYRDGEKFTPSSNTSLFCICSEGYTGENVPPFCQSDTGPPYCSPEFSHAADIYNNCAPVYVSTQNPATDCSLFSRCQNDNDTVIPVKNVDAEDSDTDFICQFGNLIMRIGDELNNATDYNSVCVRCVCEVPPLPTCQRLPDDECDVTSNGFN